MSKTLFHIPIGETVLYKNDALGEWLGPGKFLGYYDNRRYMVESHDSGTILHWEFVARYRKKAIPFTKDTFPGGIVLIKERRKWGKVANAVMCCMENGIIISVAGSNDPIELPAPRTAHPPGRPAKEPPPLPPPTRMSDHDEFFTYQYLFSDCLMSLNTGKTWLVVGEQLENQLTE